MSDREFSDFRRMAALERHYPGAGNRMGLAEYLDRVAVTIVLYGRGFRQVAIAGRHPRDARADFPDGERPEVGPPDRVAGRPDG